MQQFSKSPLKPRLQHSSLFARNLPGSIRDDAIRCIFKDFQVLRINIISADNANDSGWRHQVFGEMRGTKVAHIEFSSVSVAEKAFAVLNLRAIPDSTPPIVLMLSPSRDHLLFNSTFSGLPRLVNFMPNHYTDIDLYTLIRRFGALASAHVDYMLGGIVHFWNEEDARAAEIAVSSVFAQSLRITLQAYDPRSILCANLSPKVDEGRLTNLFKKFGFVTSVRVTHNNKGSYGLVSFYSPDEASSAIHALHGTVLDSKELVLHYHELKPSPKGATQATDAASATKREDRSASAGCQVSLDSAKGPSKPATSPSFEEKEKAEKARQDAELLERHRKELRDQENQKLLEEKARKERGQKVAEEEAARLNEEARLKDWEKATQAERERCCARDTEQWGHIPPWADSYALQRVLLVGAEFHQLKFSEEQPLTFENTPWPVLGNPTMLSLDDITWANVETFFAYAKISQTTVKFRVRSISNEVIQNHLSQNLPKFFALSLR